MKKLVPTLAAVAIVLVAAYARTHEPSHAAEKTAVASAFETHERNVSVEDHGTVVAILPDDDQGSRHQRFLVRVASGTTVLIAHNIDLAPRVEPLHRGDSISFRGEYIWNEKGGIVHWTHRDPSGRHAAGWLSLNGTVFQ